jgi:hypothetical protein
MKKKTVADCAYELFGVQVQSGRGRFSQPGWFDVGQTVCSCPKCEYPLWGLRAPYISANKTFYYWALVCRKCQTAIRPNQLSDEQKQLLYASSAHRPREEIQVSKNDNKSLAESFLMFEKFKKFENEIRSFFVQIKPIKIDTDPYFIGDGESWLKEIERVDMSRANRDAIERIASILIEWSDECFYALNDLETGKVLKEFQITLRGDPKKSIDFVKLMIRSTNRQMLDKMISFC